MLNKGLDIRITDIGGHLAQELFASAIVRVLLDDIEESGRDRIEFEEPDTAFLIAIDRKIERLLERRFGQEAGRYPVDRPCVLSNPTQIRFLRYPGQ